MAEEDDYAASFTPRKKHRVEEPSAPAAGGKAAPAEGDYASSFSPPAKGRFAGPAPKPEPTVSTAEDVIKSGAAGLGRGTAALAGLPGDVASLARFGGEYAKYYGKKAAEKAGISPEGGAEDYWKQIEQEKASPERDYVGFLPTSAATVKKAEELVPGLGYKAQTTAGKYAGTVGEFLPTAATALIPGMQEPLAAAIGRATISGLGAEAAAQLAPEEYEPYARLAGAVVAPMAAAKTLGTVASRTAAAMGASERTIKTMGLQTPLEIESKQLVNAIQKMKRAGKFAGLSEDALANFRKAEEAAGVPPEKSRMRLYMMLSNEPEDIIKTVVDPRAFKSEKFQEELTKWAEKVNENAKDVDVLTSGMLRDMRDQVTLDSVNNFRAKNGLGDALDEIPSFDDAVELAKEIRQNSWARTYGEAYRQFPALTSRNLERLIADDQVQKVIPDIVKRINTERHAEFENPLRYLHTENGEWKVGAELPDGVVSGAPLEFWHKLSSRLMRDKETGTAAVGKSIQRELDNIFKKQKVENPLKVAREKLGDDIAGANAISDGASVIQKGLYQRNPRARQAFIQKFRNLDNEEKGLYQAGMLNQAYETFAQGEKGIKDWNNLMKNAENRKLFQEIADWSPQGPGQGPSSFAQFNSALTVANTLKTMDATNVLANAPQMRGVLSRLGRLFSPGEMTLGGIALTAAEYAFAYGTNYGLMTAGVGAYNLLRDVLANYRSRKMLNTLLTSDPEKIMRLSKEISATPENVNAWKKIQKMVDFTNEKTRNTYRKAATTYAASQAAPSGGFNRGGAVEIKRATGGRIPEVDKLFRAAKRELDNESKPILNLQDDDIVKALRIMQGRV